MNTQIAPSPQLNLFFNTINLDQTEIDKRQPSDDSLAGIILQFFAAHPYENFTPFEIQKVLNLHNRPITSIRRAITNLTPDHLIKTQIMRPGDLGSPNHTWTLA